jgi:hypothetical protein
MLPGWTIAYIVQSQSGSFWSGDYWAPTRDEAAVYGSEGKAREVARRRQPPGIVLEVPVRAGSMLNLYDAIRNDFSQLTDWIAEMVTNPKALAQAKEIVSHCSCRAVLDVMEASGPDVRDGMILLAVCSDCLRRLRDAVSLTVGGQRC